MLPKTTNTKKRAGNNTENDYHNTKEQTPYHKTHFYTLENRKMPKMQTKRIPKTFWKQLPSTASNKTIQYKQILRYCTLPTIRITAK